MRFLSAKAILSFLVAFSAMRADEPEPERGQKNLTPDVIIVGAGVSGLSAAIEVGEAGLDVLVVDMWSVFGGHAVMSSGRLAVVGTPYQESENIADSVELAVRDFLAHGEVADPEWVQLYSSRSRTWVFDWLKSKGVRWDGLTSDQPAGNSVRRLHEVTGRGMGLAAPLFRHSASLPGVRFRWNEKVVRLIEKDGRIDGVEVQNQRSGARETLRARHIVLATGGFQSNLELVRKNWHGVDSEARVLKGAGINALGSGLELASAHGARIQHLDRQWNYRRGLPHPEDPDGERGLGVWAMGGIAVNTKGQRFMNGSAGTKRTVPLVVQQPGATYFQVFDQNSVDILFIAGSGWEDKERIRREIFENPAMAPYVLRADTLTGLAQKMRIDPGVLEATVTRWNGFVSTGTDPDFNRKIIPQYAMYQRITTPPFHAFKFFPMTRKSFGGIAVNTSCRVLDTRGDSIPGLWAVGEVTGFGGVNGNAALEGTMLGPSILMGRIAGQAIASDFRDRTKPAVTPSPAAPDVATGDPAELEGLQAWLRATTTTSRRGYLHFEKAHTEVLSRGLDCRRCHRGSTPPPALTSSTLEHTMLSHSCAVCHSAQEK